MVLRLKFLVQLRLLINHNISLVKKTDHDAKVTEIENEIPDVTVLIQKKNADFDIKLRNINNEEVSNKIKQVISENKQQSR